MKITVAFLPDFEPLARAVVTAIQYIVPGIKVRESNRHAPYKHIYLTTKRPIQNEKSIELQRFSGKEESPYV